MTRQGGPRVALFLSWHQLQGPSGRVYALSLDRNPLGVRGGAFINPLDLAVKQTCLGIPQRAWGCADDGTTP